LNDSNAIRVRFELEHGYVQKFMVQLECQFREDEKWKPVIRYDTAHGFAHCDRLHPYQETVKTRMTTNDYNEALSFAMNDLVNNWTAYRRRYEEWLRQK
jgi:DNA-directed RNA polymerase subunit L